MSVKNATQQLILEAVVTCIEKHGIDKVTTRKIAQEAGTNIASINYYFRSKDALISAALAMTIKHMTEDILAVMEDAQQPFEEVLKSVFYYLLEGSLRYPGISTAHLYKAITKRNYDSISAAALIKIFEKLVERAIRSEPNRDPTETRLLLSQILSSIMFTMLAPNFFNVAKKYQLTSAEHAGNLARYYTELFLNRH
ncbi:MAG TPA: TetR/AcrR family transcriptional regulator [Anaerolineales bacterium]|nr:TetR/AcrR family transcriptional regulator [Anaerolineales bacterium]